MNLIKTSLGVIGLLLAAPAPAALPVGATAPNFSAPAVVSGKEFTFSLADALKRGPVVLYFYPKSFTHGCTIEAHEFAEAAASFADAGATLIGISADPIATQQEFSSKECQDKFPLAADPDLSVIRAYDAVRTNTTTSGDVVAERISYVIAPDGKILYAYTDRAPDKHVENTLAVVQQWHRAAP